MAESVPEPEQTPAVEAGGKPTAAPARRVRIPVWLWLIVPLAAALGLLAGFGVVLRGQSLNSSPAAGPASRPTIVISAAVSPVPSGSPSPVRVGSPVASEYVVQTGDTLRSIALVVYGDAGEWPRLYDANRDLIGANPDALQAGMRLRVP